MEIVKRNGSALYNASKELKNDKQIVLMAMHNDVAAFIVQVKDFNKTKN